ncbi:MAG: cadherin-like beta sandwich domain-containing protein [Erysipelotrichaceae bacterium]
MKTKTKGIYLTTAMLFCLFGFNVHAGDVAPNSNFTIEVACGSIEGTVRSTASNATIISASNFCDRGRSVSATAKAGASGTASITFVGMDTVDTSVVPPIDASGRVIGSGSVTIIAPSTGGDTNTGGNTGGGTTVKPNPSKPLPEVVNPNDKRSTNNNISTLILSNGSLNPIFHPNETNYKVKLSAGIKEIEISAKAEDNKASIKGNGKHSLKVGNNVIEIICMAENKAIKTYLIDVYVDEKPTTFIKFEEEKLGFVNNLDGVIAPSGFTKTVLKYQGIDVNGWKNKDKTIVYLEDEKGEKNFYLIDEKSNKITSIYQQITINGKIYTILSIPNELKNMKGYEYKKLSIDKQEIEGWRFKDPYFKNYYLLYLIDGDGKAMLYQYEKESKTLQPFSMSAPLTQTTYEALVNEQEKNQIINITLIILVIISLSSNVFVYQYFKKKK